MTSTAIHTPPTPRLSPGKFAPQMYAAMSAVEESSKAGIDPGLRELMKTRASQMNGCAYCIDMHTKDARVAGETEQRLYALSAWRETPFFTEAERAALALTEALTELHPHDRLDRAWEDAQEYFEDEQLAALLMTVVAINGWNRLAIASRTPVGSYQPRSQ
ncbi:MAG: carboxymuconolactone decarboxylase family protein [Dehalococcoidia bacterium]